MGEWNEDGALSFLVRSTWLSMRAALNSELRQFDLTTPQYATLMIVDHLPGLSSSEIARQVASSRQAANEMLTGLDRDGLITRSPHPKDRRAHQIHLTDLGRARLAEARVAVARRETELEAAFTDAERRSARAWLETIAKGCG